MDELTPALDALAAEDLSRRGPVLLDDTRELLAVRNRLDAEIARRVRAAENQQAFEHDGMTSAQSGLRGHCRLSASAASQVVRTGRVLEQLPAVAAVHAAGDITSDLVDMIGNITAPRPRALLARQGGDLAGIAGLMASFAATHEHADTVRLVHAVLQRLDQDGPEPDPTEERFLTLAKHTDGSVTGRFHLDPLGAQKAQAALEALLQAGRPAGDQRTRSQQAGRRAGAAGRHPPALRHPAAVAHRQAARGGQGARR